MLIKIGNSQWINPDKITYLEKTWYGFDCKLEGETKKMEVTLGLETCEEITEVIEKIINAVK